MTGHQNRRFIPSFKPGAMRPAARNRRQIAVSGNIRRPANFRLDRRNFRWQALRNLDFGR